MGQRGFVLLIVLWSLGLLALLLAHLTAAARGETRLAGAMRNSAVLRAEAEGAMHRALFDVLRGADPADGTPRLLRLAHGEARVSVLDERGKINPNTAPYDLMTALLRVLGVDPARAQTLARSIAQWRGVRDFGPQEPDVAAYRAAGLAWGPPGRPLRRLDELSLVIGMTPDVLAALTPHLSLYQDGVLEPQASDPIVRLALETAGVNPQIPGGVLTGRDPAEPRVVSVSVEAVSRDGLSATVRAVVRLGPSAVAGRPYTILDWTD